MFSIKCFHWYLSVFEEPPSNKRDPIRTTELHHKYFRWEEALPKLKCSMYPGLYGLERSGGGGRSVWLEGE